MNRNELLEQIKAYIGTGAKVAEIGVLRGQYSQQIHKAISPSIFYLVDPWMDFAGLNYNDYVNYNQSKWDIIHDKVQQRFSSYPEVRIVRALSIDAVTQFEDGYFDFVYIDANHSYDSVLEDIKAWMPKVREGGILAGHDYNLLGVKKAVHEIFKHGVESTSEATIQSWYIKL